MLAKKALVRIKGRFTKYYTVKEVYNHFKPYYILTNIF